MQTAAIGEARSVLILYQNKIQRVLEFPISHLNFGQAANTLLAIDEFAGRAGEGVVPVCGLD
jgi:hypothetical protein